MYDCPQGELPIAMALANVVSTSQMDELARVFVTLFDAKHLLAPLLWNIFYREVEVISLIQILFSCRPVFRLYFSDSVFMYCVIIIIFKMVCRFRYIMVI